MSVLDTGELGLKMQAWCQITIWGTYNGAIPWGSGDIQARLKGKRQWRALSTLPCAGPALATTLAVSGEHPT